MTTKKLLKSALKRLALFLASSFLGIFVGTVVYSLGAPASGYLIILVGIVGGLLWVLPNKASLTLVAMLGIVNGILALIATGLLLKVFAGFFMVTVVAGVIFAGIAQYRRADVNDTSYPMTGPSGGLLGPTEIQRDL